LGEVEKGGESVSAAFFGYINDAHLDIIVPMRYARDNGRIGALVRAPAA
jgi:hypothetical protein